MHNRPFLRSLVATVCLGLAAAAFAQTSARDIPVETFFKRPQFGDMALSPDGSRLAALVPTKGRNNLVVLDVAKRTRSVITAFDSMDVADFYWVNNERICFRVADGQDVTGRFNYRGTFCINQDGSGVRDFSKFALRGLTLLARTQDGSPKAYVAMAGRTRDSDDVYLLDTETGRSQLLTFDSPGRVSRWVLDHDHVPRVAVSEPKRENQDALAWTQVWYRDSADAKWEMLWEFSQFADGAKADSYLPLAFDYDNRTLYVATNAGRDKEAIYKFDTRTRKMGELVFDNPLIDVEGRLVFSRKEKKLLGVRYSAEAPSVKWLDPAMERLQREVDLSLKGTTNVIGLAPDNENLALVYAFSETDAGMYHLLDRAKPSLEGLVRTQEWLPPSLMSERRFIRYKARDGLEIAAWLTVPKGSSGKGLPLVVHVHGGPFLRVYHGGFDLMAQFLASRGYAVLQPEPRGSTGFGKRLYRAGWKQWGLAMQDDLNDGASYLVKEGIADPKRMCIFGGSYGGYASAIGPARDPDFWKCAAPYVAVTDLTLLQQVPYSDTSYMSDYLQTDFKRLVGDSELDRDRFAKTSAINLASHVKVPILLAMGSDDVRVPQVHGDKFRDALEKAGKKVEYVVYPGEGHGFNKDEHRFDFYGRLEKFLAENLK